MAYPSDPIETRRESGSSPFPPDAPWDDMPDVGISEPDFSGLSLRQRISQHFPLAIAFLIGTLVGQTLLFLYVWWLLERAS